MVGAFVPDFEQAFSRERLEGYRGESADDLEMLTNYFWNIAPCEAMMPTFHALEVALRNSMHDAFAAKDGAPTWFNDRQLLK